MNTASQEANSETSTKQSDDGVWTENRLRAALEANNPFKAEAPQPEADESDEVEVTEDEEEVAEVESTEVEESEEETETEEESEEEAEEDESVLSQIDIDALSKEDRVELAKMLGTDLGKDISNVRRKNAELESELQSVKAQLNEGLSQLKALPEDFKEIGSAEDLESKAKEWRGYKDLIDNLMVTTDEELEINGEFYPREDVAKWGKDYEKLLSLVPEHRQRLTELSKYSESEVLTKLKKDIPELDDAESETYQEWRKLVDDPSVAIIKQLAPKTYAQLQKWAAHSVAFGKNKAPAKSISIPLKKPKNIGTRSTASRSANLPSTDRAKEAAKERISKGEYSEKDLRIAMFGA